MDQDIHEIRAEIKRLAKMTEDNTSMLRYLKRRAKWESYISVLKWIIIIGLAIGAFYYLQPVFDQISAIYNQLTGAKVDFMNLLKSFGR